MTWPVAIDLVRLSVNPGRNPLGEVANGTLIVRADFGGPMAISWSATGDSLLTLAGQIETPGFVDLPNPSQDGWADPAGHAITAWPYIARLVFRRGSETRIIERRFTVTPGQTLLDFFDLPDDELLDPSVVVVPPVTSVDGLTGDVITAAGPKTIAHPQPLSNTWFVQHNMGRKPLVQLLVGGEQVFTRTIVTDMTVTATFPNPTTGDLVIA